jgi:hypothetical protein
MNVERERVQPNRAWRRFLRNRVPVYNDRGERVAWVDPPVLEELRKRCNAPVSQDVPNRRA